MFRSINIFSFVVLSLGLHLVILLLEFSSPAVMPQVQQADIGYVVRSIEQFYPATSKSSPVLETVPEPISRKITLQVTSQSLQQKKESAETLISVNTLPRTEQVTVKIKKPDIIQVEQLASVQVPPKATVKEILTPSFAVLEPPTEISYSNVSLSESANSNDNSGESVAIVLPVADTGKAEQVTFQKALPRYDINPLPRYPEVARRRRLEGTVQLEVMVLASGRVGNTTLVASSGYKSLDRTARKAVTRWQFKPATSHGVPVDSRVVVPVDFVLRK